MTKFVNATTNTNNRTLAVRVIGAYNVGRSGAELLNEAVNTPKERVVCTADRVFNDLPLGVMLEGTLCGAFTEDCFSSFLRDGGRKTTHPKFTGGRGEIRDNADKYSEWDTQRLLRFGVDSERTWSSRTKQDGLAYPEFWHKDIKVLGLIICETWHMQARWRPFIESAEKEARKMGLPIIRLDAEMMGKSFAHWYK